MKYLLDTHTHTIASGHAYSTLSEMITYAKDIGLSLLTITEHAPNMPGTCHPFYFHNYRIFNDYDFGIPVLFGVELNILDYKGTVDMDESTLKQLALKIASIHNPCMKVGNAKENTDAYIGAMSNPLIDIIGHPDDARIPIEYERFVAAAKKHKIAIELNNSSLNPSGFRVNAYENDLNYLKLCKEYEVPISLGSDAHVCFDIANFGYASKVLEEVAFPDSLILNTSTEKLMQHLNRNK
ncbi:MAG: phosphatase [Velocimicrobium sp.]